MPHNGHKSGRNPNNEVGGVADVTEGNRARRSLGAGAGVREQAGLSGMRLAAAK